MTHPLPWRVSGTPNASTFQILDDNDSVVATGIADNATATFIVRAVEREANRERPASKWVPSPPIGPRKSSLGSA